MLGRRSRFFVVLIAFLGVLGLAAPGGAADSAGRAGRFIESLADKAIAALTTATVPREERVSRFRDLLNEHFAVKTIGRWVLGRNWNQATEAEQKEYLSLFEDLIVSTYVDRFMAYSGETLTVVKTMPATDQDLLVDTEITNPKGGKPIEVSWRVREMDGLFKIVDVIVASVSMGQTQRAEFASVIRRNGGTVEGLLSKLREDLKKGV